MLPRFVVKPDLKYVIDQSKITVESCIDDRLWLNNIIEGGIISSEIYPLIFDSDELNQTNNKYRTLDFYKLIHSNNELFNDLTLDQKIYFHIGIRDLFVASERNLLTDNEIILVKNIVCLLDENFICITINGIDSCPYPTKNKFVVRYIEEPSKEELGELFNQFFIKKNHFILTFIDPRDLSYHNFENIIPLDKFIQNNCKSYLSITNVFKYDKKSIYKFTLVDKEDLLLQIDQLHMYSNPMNQSVRGGKRFIFSSKTLSYYLTKAIKNQSLLKKLHRNFQFVNNVFRYNKFDIGDNKFLNHLDTPYYDADRKNYSKFTMIIYLTDGEANPALKIDQIEINKLTKLTGIIFNQIYEHEGNAFVDGKKIFLRTELIYHEKNFDYDPTVAKIFNISCYMTKQSIFNKELSVFTNDSFNHAARCRNKIESMDYKKPLLVKKFVNTTFITNGNDYWFSKSINIKTAGLIIILDYFNGEIENTKFNKITIDNIIDDSLADNEIYLLINTEKINDEAQSLQNMKSIKDLITEKKFIVPDYQNDYNKAIGSFSWHQLINTYHKLVNTSIDCLEKYSVVIMNNKIAVNMNDIKITDNQIIFEKTGYLTKINFAACWTREPQAKDYIHKTEKNFQGIILPPISYIIDENGVHFTIDMFNNDFIIKKNDKIFKPHNRLKINK